jgi:hypothetical protein
MPANAQDLIQSFAEVVGERSYAYSLQDTGAFLYEIPGAGVGTTLLLPDDPNNGDWYEFADVDGSCASAHPVIIAAGTDATILGGASFSFTTAFCSGRVRYSARTQAWVFVSGPGSGDLTAVDAGPGISVSTTGGVATVSNTGVLDVDAGTGIGVSTVSGVATVSNTGILAVDAGTGIGVSTTAGVATVTNDGITAVDAGTGISVSTVGGVATITNTEPAGAAITSTTTTAANVVLATSPAAVITSGSITVAAGQKVLVLFSCQASNTGEVVTGGETLFTFNVEHDATILDTFAEDAVNGTNNASAIVSWSAEFVGLTGAHTFGVTASVDSTTSSPAIVFARLTTVLLPG